MDITEINKIAELAKIQLNEATVANNVNDLNTILNLVNRLNKANTKGVAPLAHPLELTQRVRADEVTESNQREHFQQAANTDKGFYVVPKTVEA
jgi:aspartyl-tRNA(Asn)/glutamyl-tRNA(Gln) amidotransferase subunit C